jgi:magnesium transporter
VRAGHEVHHAAALHQVDLDAVRRIAQQHHGRGVARGGRLGGRRGRGPVRPGSEDGSIVLTVSLSMLVNCVVYQEGKKLADIKQSEIHDYLAKPGCFVWVALRDASDPEIEEMRQQFDLHELSVEDARHGHQRPKIEEYGSEIFTVLHVVEIAGEELHVGESTSSPGRTTCCRSATAPSRASSACARAASASPSCCATARATCSTRSWTRWWTAISRCSTAIETELEAIEGRIFANTLPRANIEALYYVKQKVTTLKHATAPLMESVGKLYGGRVPMVCQGLGEYFRDVYDHLVRLNQSLDSLRDTINTALQVNLAMITIGESEVTKRLAAYAALVAVPTMIAGVYGMNFKNMPS